MSYPVRLCQSPATRLALIHGDPVVVAMAVVVGLFGVWAFFISEGHDVENRRVRRVEAMYRRRYAGHRMVGLRAELRTCYAGLVLTCRVFPKPIRIAALATLMLMAGPATAGAWGVVPLVSSVRRRHAELADTLDTVDATPLLDRLRSYQLRGGPKGYPLGALWRAYVLNFALGLPSTNALIRLLQDDPELRLLCGFSSMPHRTTFNRFVTRLGDHRDLVDDCVAPLVDRLSELLPDFGKNVAVDSTVVDTHSNPNRKNAAGQSSDPEASWTKKHTARGKEETEWAFGYKLHMVVDATYSLPIRGHTTTARKGDSPELPLLLDRAAGAHSWFRPDYVMADKGYDSRKNHDAVAQRSGVLIAPTRRSSSPDKLYEGVYTAEGVPTCVGMVPMEYVKSDSEKGHLYRCRREGCHLRTRQGVRYCDDEYWENRRDNPRAVRPAAPEVEGVEGAVQVALVGRAGVQEHEGVPAARRSLHPGTTPDQPLGRHVHPGVHRYRAASGTRWEGGLPLDGQESSMSLIPPSGST